jgi:hypothetical protein
MARRLMSLCVVETKEVEPLRGTPTSKSLEKQV